MAPPAILAEHWPSLGRALRHYEEGTAEAFSRAGTASSRVGQRIRTCVVPLLDDDLLIAGAAKATVLPEPVFDWPATSLPCIRIGIAAAWIGAACSKPSLVDGFEQFARRPKVQRIMSSSHK